MLIKTSTMLMEVNSSGELIGICPERGLVFTNEEAILLSECEKRKLIRIGAKTNKGVIKMVDHHFYTEGGECIGYWRSAFEVDGIFYFV